MEKKKPVRRKTVTKRAARKKSSGHGLLFSFLFFMVACVLAACMNFQSAPEDTGEKNLSVTERVVDTIKSVTGGDEEEEKTDEKKVSEKKTETEHKKSKDEEKSAPKKTTGRLVVVIDDGGRDLDSQRVYEKMGIPLTLAVMPNQPHTREAAAEWAKSGLPVIIHQPMETVSGNGMEPIVLLTTMTAEQMQKILSDSMAQIPEAVGMNNHQGSKATIHRPTMNVVMKALAAKHMFFFDSATNTTTVADKAAAAYGVSYARNELFVDNSAETADIKAMIRKGAEMAKERGTAIIIGHCRPHTAEAFRQMVPVLQKEGIVFVYLADIVK